VNATVKQASSDGLPPAKPDRDDGTTPPRWVIHHVLAASGSEVLPAFARQLLGGSCYGMSQVKACTLELGRLPPRPAAEG
jgi:hypothetical protein